MTDTQIELANDNDKGKMLYWNALRSRCTEKFEYKMMEINMEKFDRQFWDWKIP